MASDLTYAFDPLGSEDEGEAANDVFPAQGPAHGAFKTELTFTGLPRPLQLAVDAAPGCGGRAWPAGEVLGRYLVARRASKLKGQRVLELGAGTGLAGLVAGMLGADVWITDQAQLLLLMEKNVALNALEGQVTAAELDWAKPVPREMARPDLILAADCVYFEPAFALLVDTLDALTSDPATEVLFCYKKRRKADKRFFALLKKKFDWAHVDDDPEEATYSRDTIYLYKVWKKRG